jgi:hypothetical protein
MCIAYLQCKGLVPNLQDPARVRQDGRDVCYAYVGWNKPEGTKLIPGFVDELSPSDPWKPSSENVDLGEVVQGFFKFYAEATKFKLFDLQTPGMFTYHPPEGFAPDSRFHAISVLHGGYVERGRAADKDGLEKVDAELKRWEAKKQSAVVTDTPATTSGQSTLNGNGSGQLRDRTRQRTEPPPSANGQPFHWARSPLVVQDPFLHDKNCARGLGEAVFVRFALVSGMGGFDVVDVPVDVVL